MENNPKPTKTDEKTPDVEPAVTETRSNKTGTRVLAGLLTISIILNAVLLFFLVTKKQPAEEVDVPTTEQEVMQEDTAEDAENEQYTLAHAIELLPNPENAVAGREIKSGLYWVWVRIDRNTDDDIGNLRPPIDQSWMVNIPQEEAHMVSERNFGPAGATTSVDPFSQQYLHVKWSGGWEGYYTWADEYFDRQTGTLAYTLILDQRQEQTAQILTEDKDLRITLAPADLCEPVSFENPEQIVEATGLNINNNVYAFPEPIRVTCTYNAMGGEKRHGFFPYINQSVVGEEHGVIRLGLPGEDRSKNVEIPTPSLDLQKIEFNGFKEEE